MIKALNTAATGMQAQSTSLENIANNLANVHTTGFKKSRAEFEDLLYQTIKEPGSQTSAGTMHPAGVQVGLGVKVAAVQKDMEVGPPKVTGRDLDVMIEGNGFFPIQMPDGQIAYTKDGSFTKDGNGRLTDKNGYPLIPEIVVPQDATKVNIAEDGSVTMLQGNSLTPTQIGEIQVVGFVNPIGLKSMGKNLYMPTPSSGQPQQGKPGENGTGRLSSGQLEGSNVNVVNEMIDMIQTQRSYESSSKVIQAADQMMQYTNQLR